VIQIEKFARHLAADDGEFRDHHTSTIAHLAEHGNALTWLGKRGRWATVGRHGIAIGCANGS
jgi:hypothetical protein